MDVIALYRVGAALVLHNQTGWPDAGTIEKIAQFLYGNR